MSDSERRKTSRVTFKQRCSIKRGADSFGGSLKNLSLQGCCLKLEDSANILVGVCVTFSIALHTESAKVEFGGKAQIAWIDNIFLGLRFVEMSADDLSILRRIVELNAGNADKITEELRHLINIEGLDSEDGD